MELPIFDRKLSQALAYGHDELHLIIRSSTSSKAGYDAQCCYLVFEGSGPLYSKLLSVLPIVMKFTTSYFKFMEL